MKQQYLWTLDGSRLHYQSGDNNIRWLFLPGGPGLGVEAIASLTALLQDTLPGFLWHVDLPNDGSNILPDKPISNWRSAIVQAASALKKTILVAHSTLGMFLQTISELENIVYGLVLIGSAPDASWQKSFAEYSENQRDESINKAEEKYAQHPDDESVRQLLIASAKYCQYAIYRKRQSAIREITH